MGVFLGKVQQKRDIEGYACILCSGLYEKNATIKKIINKNAPSARMKLDVYWMIKRVHICVLTSLEKKVILICLASSFAQINSINQKYS